MDVFSSECVKTQHTQPENHIFTRHGCILHGHTVHSNNTRKKYTDFITCLISKQTAKTSDIVLLSVIATFYITIRENISDQAKTI